MSRISTSPDSQYLPAIVTRSAPVVAPVPARLATAALYSAP